METFVTFGIPFFLSLIKRVSSKFIHLFSEFHTNIYTQTFETQRVSHEVLPGVVLVHLLNNLYV